MSPEFCKVDSYQENLTQACGYTYQVVTPTPAPSRPVFSVCPGQIKSGFSVGLELGRAKVWPRLHHYPALTSPLLTDR